MLARELLVDILWMMWETEGKLWVARGGEPVEEEKEANRSPGIAPKPERWETAFKTYPDASALFPGAIMSGPATKFALPLLHERPVSSRNMSPWQASRRTSADWAARGRLGAGTGSSWPHL